ncbi:hypothetical protein TGARI_283855 [Toxoplasma gondii ARI]|uniref:Uncharacterized protein n=1 Tax=Toxoplasma gondii ARI TaxID=1074872 RepID=A0A139XJN5_TOXGO|nr:hypothetical protein TGARI_283855 [Toxoplasma gondii ARI]
MHHAKFTSCCCFYNYMLNAVLGLTFCSTVQCLKVPLCLRNCALIHFASIRTEGLPLRAVFSSLLPFQLTRADRLACTFCLLRSQRSVCATRPERLCSGSARRRRSVPLPCSETLHLRHFLPLCMRVMPVSPISYLERDVEQKCRLSVS